MRQSSGSLKSTRNGGHLHILRENTNFYYKRTYQTWSYNYTPVAPINRRHKVYEAFLNTITLDKEHAENLVKRGLHDTTVAEALYASIPSRENTTVICKELADGYDLKGVAGFYTDKDGCWRLNAYSSGLLIPVRDVNKNIQACQIRLDKGDTRYIWLSSSDKLNGASASAPIHFAGVWCPETTHEVIITEGALKADIIAGYFNACVVAVSGVASFSSDFGLWLKTQLPVVKRTYIAYDADFRTKSTVRDSLIRLTANLEDAGLKTEYLIWDGAKGLDDFLVKEVA